MIAFRQIDGRYPLLWDSSAQPAGRWHAGGDGPAHYFSDTPDAAWAEFLRHEEITDPEDLATVRRQMWAVEIGDPPVVGVNVPPSMLGDPQSYLSCQIEAGRLRQETRCSRLAAPSAALSGGVVVVVFGATEGLAGWVAGDAARPAPDLLGRVRHYGST